MNDMSSTTLSCVWEYQIVDIAPQESGASLCDELQDKPPYLGVEIVRQYLDDWHGCFEQDSSSTVTPDDVYIERLCARIAAGEVDIMTFYHEFDVFLHSDTP